MAAHRYWRLQIRATGGGVWGNVGELQMRTSIGGTNVATGGTPSASSEANSTWAAAKAFDGLTTDTGAGNAWSANYFAGSDGFGSFPWLKYDFGAGNEKDIQEIVIYAPGSGGAGIDQFPTAWDFQYSDDNVHWVTQRSYAFDPSTPAWTYNSSRVYDVRPLGPIDIHNYTPFGKIVNARYIPPYGDPLHPYQTNRPILDPTRFYHQNYRGGLYKIAGTTTVLGNPAPRRVRLYAQDSGRIYAEQNTGPDGLFEFRNLDIGPWTVVGIDDTGTQNGVIFTHINAVPM